MITQKDIDDELNKRSGTSPGVTVEMIEKELASRNNKDVSLPYTVDKMKKEAFSESTSTEDVKQTVTGTMPGMIGGTLARAALGVGRVGSSIVAGALKLFGASDEWQERNRQLNREWQDSYRQTFPSSVGQTAETVGEIGAQMALPGGLAKRALPAAAAAAPIGAFNNLDVQDKTLTSMGIDAAKAAALTGTFIGASNALSNTVTTANKVRQAAGQVPEGSSLAQATKDPALIQKELNMQEFGFLGNKKQIMNRAKEIVKRSEETLTGLSNKLSWNLGEDLPRLAQKAYDNFKSKPEVSAPLSTTLKEPIANTAMLKSLADEVGKLKPNVSAPGMKAVHDELHSLLKTLKYVNISYEDAWKARTHFDQRLKSLVETGNIAKKEAQIVQSKVRQVIEGRMEDAADKLGIKADYITMKRMYANDLRYTEFKEMLGIDRGKTGDFYTPTGEIDPVKFSNKVGKWLDEITDSRGKVNGLYKNDIPQALADAVIQLNNIVKFNKPALATYFNKGTLPKAANASLLFGETIGKAANVVRAANAAVQGRILSSTDLPKLINSELGIKLLAALNKFKVGSNAWKENVNKLIMSLSVGTSESEDQNNGSN